MNKDKLNIADGFISRETAYFIHDYLKKRTHQQVPDQYHPNGLGRFPVYQDGKSVFFNADSVEDKVIFDLLTLIAKSAGTQFNKKNDEINLLTMAYTNYNAGQSLPLHNDWAVSKNEVHSAILYLTDDYEGGEFLWYDHFDNNNPSLNKYTASTPKSGQLYYFNGTIFNHHEVLPVTEGERSCLVLFFTGLNPRA